MGARICVLARYSCTGYIQVPLIYQSLRFLQVQYSGTSTYTYRLKVHLVQSHRGYYLILKTIEEISIFSISITRSKSSGNKCSHCWVLLRLNHSEKFVHLLSYCLTIS
jgi:hypothetical protein